MGSQQSQPQSERRFESDEHLNTQIKFSNSLINELDDSLNNNDKDNKVDYNRQISLDDQIRNRINSELNRLRSEEYSVRDQIEKAIQSENLSKELSNVDNSNILSTQSVKANIDQIKSKVDRHHKKRDLNEWPEIKNSQNDLIKCFNDEFNKPLNCYKQVETFKKVVNDAEKVSF